MIDCLTHEVVATMTAYVGPAKIKSVMGKEKTNKITS